MGFRLKVFTLLKCQLVKRHRPDRSFEMSGRWIVLLPLSPGKVGGERESISTMHAIRKEVKSKPRSKRRSRTDKRFEAAIKLRSQWGVSQPKLHVIPRWIRKRVLAAIRAGLIPPTNTFLMNPWHALRHAALTLGGDWIDHAGTLSRDGRELLVSEPYGITGTSTRQLEEFCRVLGLRFEISAVSWWLPSQTIRITVSEVHND